MARFNNYTKDKENILDFLATFYIESDDFDGKQFVYADQILKLAEREQIAIHISLDDLQNWCEEHSCAKLATNIRENTRRYQKIFADAIDELIHKHWKDGNKEPPVKDALDAFIYQRIEMAQQKREQQRQETGMNPTTSEQEDLRSMYPPELMRRFEINFSSSKNEKALPVREVRAVHIGKLIKMRGIVIRATEVKPHASVITYTCDTCANETYQPITGLSFTPALQCPSKDCTNSRAGGRLMMQVRGSKFEKFQKLRIQEHSDQVPIGSIPRAINVYVSGENTRKASPGDHVELSGVYLPLLRTGFRAMTAGLLSEVYLEAHEVVSVNESPDDNEEPRNDFTEEEQEILAQPDLYTLMANSIAPEIYGHEDIKKSLLLQLCGGVDKNATGMRIRGTINICLMGDPGVAKSQLLCYIDRLSPRSQYTTGRGSSGVGLTAAIMKDPLTGEMTLEGGALVLADRGICCIDEFDKMMDFDRTAIHEVMEQQTISIAKAGIMTTLNARTAILAAANPAYGRYNAHRTIEQNIQLPAALLSRFDLLWLIQDKADEENDLRLAQHITYVHQYSKNPDLPNSQKLIGMETMRKYLNMAKKVQPVVPKELTTELVNMYVELRKDARNATDTTFTSPRVLLAAIRLATSLARLRFSAEVSADDAREAMRLMIASKESLRPEKKTGRRPENPIDVIYRMACEMQAMLPVDAVDQTIAIQTLVQRAAQRRYTDEQVEEMIRIYTDNGVLMEDNGRLIFIQA